MLPVDSMPPFPEPAGGPEVAAPSAPVSSSDGVEKPASSGRRRRRRRRGRSSDEVQTAAETAPRAAGGPGRPQRGGASAPADDEADTDREPPGVRGRRDMLVNVSKGEECRIAIVHNGRIEELYVERVSAASHVGNIYKGVVTNVEPSIQAAFIDFGLAKNGFLHISDLQPQYFPSEKRGAESVGQKISRKHRPPIQKCLKKGDKVIVQVIKEGIGTKGPTLSSYLSIPGRYLVMMPGMNKVGVSRKIEDDQERKDMREALGSLKLPSGMGFILRTAGLGRGKRDLQRDLNYLSRLWKKVVKRIKGEDGPALLYKESDLVVRTIRDVVTSEFDRIVVDDPEAAASAREFLSVAMPRSAGMVEQYTGHDPLFHKHGIESQIESLYSKHVALPSGGSLIIESTEALVAIDVNSGKYRRQDNPEATAYKINMEAAEEIAHQLRLRDLGGLIICDFIDMIADKHKHEVEKTLRTALKAHKERVQILRMSQFGIIEMTRQRQRPSIKRSLFQDCPQCEGSGLVKTLESQMLDVMRLIQRAIHQPDVHVLTVRVNPAVASSLLNRKRLMLTQLESRLAKHIVVEGDAAILPGRQVFEGFDREGRPVTVPQVV
jgi:ribonuclease E